MQYKNSTIQVAVYDYRFEEIGYSFRVTMYEKDKVNEAVNEVETVILEIFKLNNQESRTKNIIG